MVTVFQKRTFPILMSKTQVSFVKRHQAWYAEFLLEINLKILLRKTGARLIFKIAHMSLHIDPGILR
jgi:hypothetical protein